MRLEQAHPDKTISEIMSLASHITLGRNTMAKAAQPYRNGRLFLSRVGQILGKETFLTQKSLAPPMQRFWMYNLKHGFTWLILLGIIFAPFAPVGFGLGCAGCFLVYTLGVGRSRYRMGILPLLAVITGTGVATVSDATFDQYGVLAAMVVFAIGLLVLVQRLPQKRER